jgi:methylenetetrahydrofolate dehydrogenase (NADP+)/methenyltetrahydrofolate cyclohydrolase
MSAFILDGKEIAQKIKRKLSNHIESLKKSGIVPSLAVVRIGENPASKIYVTSKCRQGEEIGIQAFEHHLPESITREAVLDLLYRLNADPKIHGILVQFPLPPHLNMHEIVSTIDPMKDVDGLHPLNIGELASGHRSIVPCTPKGCMILLKEYQKNLKGLKAVVIGRSMLVGRPLSFLLLQEDCTVTVVHSKSSNIEQECMQADILIAAVGVPKLVTKKWVKPGAIVIDVGINYLIHPDGTSDLVGDVDFHTVKEIAQAITPVPGGVGPMTVACLLQNTVEAAQRLQK